MKHLLKSYIVFSLLVGLLIGITAKNYAFTVDLPAMGDMGILMLWKDTEKEVKDLENNSTNLKDKIQQMEAEIALDQEVLNLLKSRDDLKIEIGLGSIAGPGLIVTLDDSPIRLREGDDPSFYIIHESYLRYLINILKEGQARGIAVNSERIQINSDISCVGKVILVNGKRIAPPYDIKAIGDPELMAKVLKQSSFFRLLENYKTLFGLQVSLKVSPYLELPQGTGVIDLESFGVAP